VLCAVVCLIWFCEATDQAGPNTLQTSGASPIFEEIADQVGLKFQHYNGMTGKFFLPEIMGAGSALFDYDNDGDLDVFLVQGSILEESDQPAKTLFPWRGRGKPRSSLFRNDLRLTRNGPQIVFTDVTETSKIISEGYGMGVTVGDINNDGWNDLYVTNLGSNQMFLNKGDGTFADVTRESGTDDSRWSTSASFFDYDRDGWLDLVTTQTGDFDWLFGSEYYNHAVEVLWADGAGGFLFISRRYLVNIEVDDYRVPDSGAASR